MDFMKDSHLDAIKDILNGVQKDLTEKFQDSRCLILYGSWAKGVAHKDSDIDLLAVFERADRDSREFLHKIEWDATTEKSITIVPASVDDFQKEKVPLYTAVKREGKVIILTMGLQSYVSSLQNMPFRWHLP